jgi:hypothetical protein
MSKVMIADAARRCDITNQQFRRYQDQVAENFSAFELSIGPQANFL